MKQVSTPKRTAPSPHTVFVFLYLSCKGKVAATFRGFPCIVGSVASLSPALQWNEGTPQDGEGGLGVWAETLAADILLLKNIHHYKQKLPKLNTLTYDRPKADNPPSPAKNLLYPPVLKNERGCTEKNPQTGGWGFIGNLTYVQFEIYWVLTLCQAMCWAPGRWRWKTLEETGRQWQPSATCTRREAALGTQTRALDSDCRLAGFPEEGKSLGSVRWQKDISQGAGMASTHSSGERAWVSSGLHVLPKGGTVRLVGGWEGRGGWSRDQISRGLKGCVDFNLKSRESWEGAKVMQETVLQKNPSGFSDGWGWDWR